MKKIFGMIIATCFIFLSSPLYAAEPVIVNVDSTVIRKNELSMYFSTNIAKSISKGQLKATMGNTELKIGSLSRLREVKDGVSYLFMVDVSGSMKDSKFTAIKKILNSAIGKLSSRDNASIAFVGNDFSERPYSSDKKVLQKEVNELKAKNENTNMYQGITKALNSLSSIEGLKEKKCLVILSDGEEDYVTGITREEVTKQIEKKHIPIFTVAMLDKKSNAKKIEASKILGSFARQSPGGLDLTFGLSAITENDITASIDSKIRNSYKLTADIEKVKADGKEQYLKLELRIKGQGSSSDGYNVLVTKEVKRHKDKSKGIFDYLKDNPLIIVGIAIGIVLVLVLLGLVIRKKHSQKNIVPPENPTAGDDRIVNNTIAEISSSEESIAGTVAMPEDAVACEDKTMAIPTEQESSVCKGDKLNVRLTKMGQNIDDEVFEIMIFDKVIIGRDAAKADVAFTSDDILSGRHCKLSYRDSILYICDLGSTNGTYVNGVPIGNGKEYVLHNDDVILMGSMELRVNFKSE